MDAKTFVNNFKTGKGIFAAFNPGGAAYSLFKKKQNENQMKNDLRDQYQDRLTGLLEEQYAQQDTNNTPYYIAGAAIIGTLILLIIYRRKHGKK